MERYLAKKDASIPFTLVRRKNQKHINIRVHHDGRVTVSAPARTSDARVGEAVNIKEEWIRNHVTLARKKISSIDELSEIPLAGVPHRVTVEYEPGRRGRVHLDKTNQLIHIKTGSADRRARIDALVRFLKRYCVDVISPEIHSVSKPMKIKINKIFYRNQKTRWGSSSERGNISLNFRAVLLPPEVRSYLLLHELVHQVHMNHSQEFWKYLAKVCPDYRKNDRWLKDHAFYLGLFR